MTKKQPGFGLAATLLTVTALLSPPASAQPVSLIPTWEFEVGSLFTSTTTDIRADSAQGDLGTAFRAEDLLGLDKEEALLRLTAARRIGKRHQVGLRYYDSSRSGRVVVPFDISFNDIVIPVTATVDTRWDSSFTELLYTYYFSVKEKTAWGASLGLARWEFDIALTGSGARLNRQVTSETNVDELVPELGVTVRHRLSPKFMLKSDLSGLKVELGDQDVTIVGATLRFDYQAFKNLGFAIAGSYSDIDYADNGGRFIGQFDYNVTGVQVFIPIYID